MSANVYRKPAHNGDEARQGSRMNLLIQCAERARSRCIFVQRPVCSDQIVIAGVGPQNSTQMRLAEDDEMIHALAAD
jgi:hypothetical protein